MNDYADTMIQSYLLEFYFTDDDVLTNQLGFNVAFGLTEFDGSSEFIEDPDYGTMSAKIRQWGFEGPHGTIVESVDTHRCKLEEFGLDENGDYIGEDRITVLTDEQKDPESEPFFFPPNDNSKDFIITYHPKMHCFDERQKLQGEYDSSKAR